MRSYRKIGNYLSQVYVVNRNVIGSEVRDIKAGVMERDHAPRRLIADQETPRNFVARGLDNRDAARLEIERGQFSSIRLQRQAPRRFPHVQQRQQFVIL